ncbi:hypothetical protein EIJ81_00695 (plasmid) [Aliivibrio salmonicida]|uniref:hypothetical protein n=1 Tax=Aliivibrio salmonicida TaxID=40269 RepID=UPI000F6FCCCD|nr:hypothetical protein [Aliivibrio salmonicida]AZL83417.1 hypothetical protein EIJ81_00695 [Aliivibrio salmonicida]
MTSATYKTENDQQISIESRMVKKALPSEVFRICSADEALSKNEFDSTSKMILNYICLKLKQQSKNQTIKHISSVILSRNEFNQLYAIKNTNYYFNQKNVNNLRGRGLLLFEPPIEDGSHNSIRRRRSFAIFGDIVFLGPENGGTYLIDIPHWYKKLVTGPVKQFGEILVPATTKISGQHSYKLFDLICRHDRMNTFISIPLFELYEIVSTTYLEDDIKTFVDKWNRNPKNKITSITDEEIKGKFTELKQAKIELLNKKRNRAIKLRVRDLITARIFNPLKSMLNKSDNFIYNLRPSLAKCGYVVSQNGPHFSEKTKITIYLGIDYTQAPKNIENTMLYPLTNQNMSILSEHKSSLTAEENYTTDAIKSIEFNAELFKTELSHIDVPLVPENCDNPTVDKTEIRFLHDLFLYVFSLHRKPDDKAVLDFIASNNKSVEYVMDILNIVALMAKNDSTLLMTDHKISGLVERLNLIVKSVPCSFLSLEKKCRDNKEQSESNSIIDDLVAEHEISELEVSLLSLNKPETVNTTNHQSLSSDELLNESTKDNATQERKSECVKKKAITNEQSITEVKNEFLIVSQSIKSFESINDPKIPLDKLEQLSSLLGQLCIYYEQTGNAAPQLNDRLNIVDSIIKLRRDQSDANDMLSILDSLF